MAPKRKRIWNEDLVLALRAREEMARQQGKQRQFLWRDGAQILEGVRHDIYMFKTGRVVGLPTHQLKKTVDDLCRKIMTGDEPVLPEGYAPAGAEERSHFTGGNPVRDHPYLKRIKIRGGAFAILMAFHLCRGQRQSMTKDQIIRAAQPFCDEAMEGNFHAGRPIGAWKSHETLVKHGFVVVQKARVAYNERAGGLRAMGKSSYSLSHEGEHFIEALLQLHPDVQNEIGIQSTYASSSSSATAATGNSAWMDGFGGGSPLPRALSTNEQADKERLVGWLETASEGSSIDFDVGKDRRKRLHRLCDELSSSPALRTQGVVLDHMSSGTNRQRALRISLVPSSTRSTGTSTATARMTHEQLLPPETPELTSTIGSVHHRVTRSPDRDDFPRFASPGGVLSEVSPSKRLRTTESRATVRASCESAALLRRALFESQQESDKSTTTAAVPNSSIIELVDDLPPPSEKTKKKTAYASIIELVDDSPAPSEKTKKKTVDVVDLVDEFDVNECIMDQAPRRDDTLRSDSKPTAIPKRKLDFPASNVLELLESDDDDDELLAGGPTFKTKCERVRSSSFKDSQLIDIPHGALLSIAIDNRERNRNCTPRFLRTELVRLVSSGPVSFAWPSVVRRPQVVEMPLTYGDFNFLMKNESGKESTLAVMVERKRIGDLVQRSATRDHWGQLQRMRDRCSALSVLLLEGDFRTAAAFVAFGAPEGWRKRDHVIDDEESLLRFMGRAILSSGSFRFVQTKDEQESLRAVAALGLVSMVALAKQTDQQVDKLKNPYKGSDNGGPQILADRLQAGGIPWQIAKDLSQELGSVRQFDSLYAAIEDSECREQLFAPFIEDACLQVESESSPHAWSKAIHSAHYTTCCNSQEIRARFQGTEQFVTDRAELLSRLHSGQDPEAAINASFDSSGSASSTELGRRRVVQIQLPEHLKDTFESTDCLQHTSFYRMQYSPRKNLVVMQTRDERYESEPLAIFLLEGITMVEQLRSAMNKNSDCFIASRSLAAQLDREVCRRPVSMSPSYFSRRVLLIRGLRPALEQMAKKSGYRRESRFVSDLALAHLMISHGIVVIHAVRKGDAAAATAASARRQESKPLSDQAKILRSLALACFHFQLLTKKRSLS